MSKTYDKNGNEIIKSPYIVDCDYIDYSKRIKEMVQNGLVSKYHLNNIGNSVFDDNIAEREAVVSGNYYPDISDIAEDISSANSRLSKSNIKKVDVKKEVEKTEDKTEDKKEDKK